MAADSTMFLTMNLFTALSFGTNAPLDSQNTLLTCVNVDEKISHESVSMEINGHKTSRRLRVFANLRAFPKPAHFGFERHIGRGQKRLSKSFTRGKHPLATDKNDTRDRF